MMKIVKINSMTCMSCIIMNNVMNKIKDNYNIEIENIDYDFDDISKYNVGKILPVIIFYNGDKEIKRLEGEHSYSEIERIIKDEEV